MNHDPSANRSYETSQQQTLFTLYGEVCSGWRMLTDVRFKLLGFIPVVSGVVLFSLLSNKSDGPSPLARMGIALFGLLITIALFIYEKRNSELYGELIGRGKKIEEELGIDIGVFRARGEPSSKFIRHAVAVNLIYGASMAAWLASLLIIFTGA